MNPPGCESCRKWLQELHWGEMLRLGDCKSSFKRKHSYFSADLLRCPACGVVWLLGHYENFDNTPIEDEWGERTGIRRPVSEKQVAEIAYASGTECLDIDTFAKEADGEDPDGDAGDPGNGTVIKNESGLLVRNPTFAMIEGVVRGLDRGEGNSFCCLEGPDGSYVQALRGLNGCHLEWRITGSGSNGYVHWRACLPDASSQNADLLKSDAFDVGEERDLLGLDEVVAAFRAFHTGAGLPANLEWRDLGI